MYHVIRKKTAAKLRGTLIWSFKIHLYPTSSFHAPTRSLFNATVSDFRDSRVDITVDLFLQLVIY